MGQLFPDREYIRWNPFDGDRDVVFKMRTVAIVTVRKEHPCFEGVNPDGPGPHTIKPGERARHETALVDGHWGKWYCCLPCMDKWLTEVVRLVPEEAT